MSEIKISVAGPQDAEELLEIYAPYVRDTAVSFEYTVPSPEEFRQRIIHTLEKYPYLKAEKDGEMIGQQWGILHNGGNPDAATPREGRSISVCKLLSAGKIVTVPD